MTNASVTPCPRASFIFLFVCDSPADVVCLLFAGSHLRLREAALPHRDPAPRHHLHLLHDRVGGGTGGAGQDPEGIGAPQAPSDIAGVAGCDGVRQRRTLLVSVNRLRFSRTWLLKSLELRIEYLIINLFSNSNSKFNTSGKFAK